jgi:hypothetical protein
MLTVACGDGRTHRRHVSPRRRSGRGAEIRPLDRVLPARRMSRGYSVITETAMRAKTADNYARSAGFDGSRPLGIEHDFFRFYRLH